MPQISDVTKHFYNEIEADGFTSDDGTIEFYNRINALVDKAKVALDFGAGRGEWYEDYQCEYRKNLRNLGARAKKVVGCDVDQAVLSNRTLDASKLIGQPLLFEDNTFDTIVADWAFEHISNP